MNTDSILYKYFVRPIEKGIIQKNDLALFIFVPGLLIASLALFFGLFRFHFGFIEIACFAFGVLMYILGYSMINFDD